jgi:hypothetical protein
MDQSNNKLVSKGERMKRAHEIMNEEDQPADIGEQPATTQAKQATATTLTTWNTLKPSDITNENDENLWNLAEAYRKAIITCENIYQKSGNLKQLNNLKYRTDERNHSVDLPSWETVSMNRKESEDFIIHKWKLKLTFSQSWPHNTNFNIWLFDFENKIGYNIIYDIDHSNTEESQIIKHINIRKNFIEIDQNNSSGDRDTIKQKNDDNNNQACLLVYKEVLPTILLFLDNIEEAIKSQQQTETLLNIKNHIQ